MRIQAAAPEGATECVTVVTYLKPDDCLENIQASLLPPDELAMIIWPREARAGWVQPPAYFVSEAFPAAMVFECHYPAHKLVSLCAVAKPRESTCQTE